jgi:hypothetical protein
MFVQTILQALNRNRKARHRKLTDPIYPDSPASDAANIVLTALSFALI